MDLEAVESSDELIDRSFRSILRVNHEEHMRKACAEVGSVGMVMSRALGRVHVHAFRAVELHHGFARYLRQTDLAAGTRMHG